MCTASWMRTDSGYHVFFNRDERPVRRPATPPRVVAAGAVRSIAPQDGDFGGTWLTVNESGVTLFLHNGYAGADEDRRAPADGFTSRGLLVESLAGSDSPRHALERLRDLELARFRTFLLVAFDATGAPSAVRWDGTRLAAADDELAAGILVSSSFRRDAVRDARAGLLRAMLSRRADDPVRAHLDFHRSHLPERGPYSPCMHRDDAGTVSFTWVAVDGEGVRVRYAPGPPCQTPLLDDAVELPRRHAPA